MSTELRSVVISRSVDGLWQAQHVPSGRVTRAASIDEAQNAMCDMLGVNRQGTFDEPLTSVNFEGLAQAVAKFLEGPISESLASHSGFARLDQFEDGVAQIRLGGGCRGCPSAQITLFSGVRSQLQDRFGDDVVTDVIPSPQ